MKLCESQHDSGPNDFKVIWKSSLTHSPSNPRRAKIKDQNEVLESSDQRFGADKPRETWAEKWVSCTANLTTGVGAEQEEELLEQGFDSFPGWRWLRHNLRGADQTDREPPGGYCDWGEGHRSETKSGRPCSWVLGSAEQRALRWRPPPQPQQRRLLKLDPASDCSEAGHDGQGSVGGEISTASSRA